MHERIEAIVDTDGQVTLLEPIEVNKPCRAVVVLHPLEEESSAPLTRIGFEAFAEEWDRAEEDEAWAYLKL